MLAGMAVLVLVRHAVTDQTGKRLYGRRPGIHLSARGRDQSEEVARRLAGQPIAAVYSSPLERCMETAEVIAGVLGLAVHDEPGVIEADTGAWTGRTFAQITRTRLWRRMLAVPSATRLPGGESAADVQARTVRALDAVAERYPEDAVVVVSHGDPIRLALAQYAGIHLDLFQRLEVAPASVSVVGTGEHGPRLLRLNDTGPLDLAGPRGGRMRRR
jgi:probable phosphomutase (TIGR03848 family)